MAAGPGQVQPWSEGRGGGAQEKDGESWGHPGLCPLPTCSVSSVFVCATF